MNDLSNGHFRFIQRRNKAATKITPRIDFGSCFIVESGEAEFLLASWKNRRKYGRK